MSNPVDPVPPYMTERLARWRRATDWPLMALALRALRAERLFRLVAVLLRGVAIGGAVRVSGRQLVREHTVALAFGIAGLTWITSVAAFTMVEDVGVGQRYDSFGDALWWALATITTVGYGDVAPQTAAGRVIGGFTMIVGISTFALVTAKIAQFQTRSALIHGRTVSLHDR